MIHPLPDPLLERVAAAAPRPPDDDSVPAFEEIAAARRRRTARRVRRLSVAGGLAAVAVTVALALAPSNPTLDDRGILVRAVEASALPSKSIVVIDSVLTTDSSVAPEPDSERKTTWLLTSRSGRIVRFRELTTESKDQRGFEWTGWGRRPPTGRPPESLPERLSRSYDPRTGKITEVRLLDSASPVALAVQSHKLLRIASHADEIQNPIEREGSLLAFRKTHIIRRGAVDPAGIRVTREILLDPATYRPVRIGEEETFRYDGAPAFNKRELRVVSRRTLPDTPENRRLLELRGPTR